MSDELKQAVEAKRKQMDSPQGKDEQIRKLMFGDAAAIEKDYANEADEMISAVPEWANPEIAASDEIVMTQAAGMMGYTNNDIANMSAKDKIALREDTLKFLQKTSGDNKVETARNLAKLRGTDNPDAIIAIYAQLANVK